MLEAILKRIRKYYNKLVHSIAFLPALMTLGFLLLALLTMELDAMGWGNQLSKKFKWLTLKDAETARSIVSTIAQGLISLTVFSFSMVMIVMNQAAQQMSNRLLDNLVGNRTQKVVLGLYIGTTVYALILLTNISSVEQDNAVPSFSIYLLITIAVMDIFLFVYFLHYITQSIRYSQLIQNVHRRTIKTIKKYVRHGQSVTSKEEGTEVVSDQSGYFQSFSKLRLIEPARKQDIVIYFLHVEGTYIVEGTPLLKITGKELPDASFVKRILSDIDFFYGQEIDTNPYYGFQHLMETGVKALSPGINDPATAVLSLTSLTDLLAYRMKNPIPNVFTDKEGNARIVTKELRVEEIIEKYVLPVWDYGKKDRLVQTAMLHMINQLEYLNKHTNTLQLLNKLKSEIKYQQDQLPVRY